MIAAVLVLELGQSDEKPAESVEKGYKLSGRMMRVHLL
jgi:hypothetical protein